MRICLLGALAFVVACKGAESSPSGADVGVTGDAGVADSGIDTGRADAGATDVGAVDAGGVDAGPPHDCTAEADVLAKALVLTGRACDIVLRFDYESKAPLGYQFFCGEPTSVDETQARARANEDTGYGDGTALSSSSFTVYAFYEAPGDFGGASVVSGVTGMSLFGGSIVWDGTGEIVYPETWRSADELGSRCVPSMGVGSFGAVDFLQSPDGFNEEASALLDLVNETAVPAAVWRDGEYIYETTVIRYPRTVGAFNPANAEWLAIVHARSND